MVKWDEIAFPDADALIENSYKANRGGKWVGLELT